MARLAQGAHREETMVAGHHFPAGQKSLKKGDLFPFEQTGRCQMTKKADRFDFAMISQQRNTLGGLSPFDEEPCLPSNQRKAAIVEIKPQRVCGDRDLSLQEARWHQWT